MEVRDVLYYVRPDAITALEREEIQKVLGRYVKVAKNELPANFVIARSIEFDFRKSMSLDELWEEHGKLIKEFRKLRRKVDSGKVDLKDLKRRRFSLLTLKAIIAKELMNSCKLCEWRCGVNRNKGELGVCKVGPLMKISSEQIHLGEESFFVPSHTVFFWSCNFDCVFCQNYEISKRIDEGHEITPTALAKLIDSKRAWGSRNLNLVGGEPTPYLYWIIKTLEHVKLNVPVVWNSNMYMSTEAMKLLDGVVDVYLTDFKYGNDECALRLSKVPKYFEVVSRNHKLAVKQAEVVIRHLVMPNHLECCTFPVLDWISKNLGKKVLVNVMNQYVPYYRAKEYKDIARRVYPEEYETALEKAKKLKLIVVS